MVKEEDDREDYDETNYDEGDYEEDDNTGPSIMTHWNNKYKRSAKSAGCSVLLLIIIIALSLISILIISIL